jgi:hypothetical protein
MEDIKTEADSVTLNISGTYSPQELRELFRKLSKAHAAASKEVMQGEPLFAFGGAVQLGVGAGPMQVYVGIHAPTFGWVRAELNIPRAEMLVNDLQAAIGQATAANVAKH